MKTMRERLAARIADSLDAIERGHIDSAIDAILDELREPDEGMIEAAHALDEDAIISPIHDRLALLTPIGPGLIFRAMIDAAR